MKIRAFAWRVSLVAGISVGLLSLLLISINLWKTTTGYRPLSSVRAEGVVETAINAAAPQEGKEQDKSNESSPDRTGLQTPSQPLTNAKIANIHQGIALQEFFARAKNEQISREDQAALTEPYLLADYAAQCKAYMGTVPEFSCTQLNSENNILHAEIIGLDKGAGVCPQLGNDENCVITGTVEGRLVEPTDAPAGAKVTMLFSCRRYDSLTPPGRFDDIAVIQHDATTGNTCWFQSPTVLEFDGRGNFQFDEYGYGVYKDWSGELIPSPMDYGAHNFWLHPYQPDDVIDYSKNNGVDDMRARKRGVVASMNCQRCHDADPFLWSPYFQTLTTTHLFTNSGRAIEGWNSSGNYVSSSFGLFSADGTHRAQAYRFNPTDNPCGDCHQFGQNTMSRKLQGDSRFAHLLDQLQKDTDKKHPWMPPAAATTFTQTVTITTVKMLQDCAVNPTGTYLNAANETKSCNGVLPNPAVRPNLMLTTQANPSILIAGHEVQYTILLHNKGINATADTATGIQVLDTLPSGVTPVQAPDGCTITPTSNSSSVSCTIDSLADGAEKTIVVRAKVNALENASSGDEVLTNKVEITTTATDNIGTVQALNVQPVRRDADLSVQPQASLEPVAGATLTHFKLKYTLTVANAGPAVAANVILSQTLPAGAVYDTGLSSVRCAEDAGIVRCNLGELNDGRTSTINLFATIPADLGPIFTSQATVTAVAPDPDLANNQRFAVTFDQATVAQLYLPWIATARPRNPDLIVKAIRITPEAAEVVIQNRGDLPLSSTDRFWVDLYINLNAPPTGVNQTVQERHSDGLVWGVISPTLQLGPGAEYTLRVGDHYYDRKQSSVPDQIAAGSVIYVQVDSANVQSNNGGVLEEHERNGGVYNNISSVTLVETISTRNWPVRSRNSRTVNDVNASVLSR